MPSPSSTATASFGCRKRPPAIDPVSCSAAIALTADSLSRPTRRPAAAGGTASSMMARARAMLSMEKSHLCRMPSSAWPVPGPTVSCGAAWALTPIR